MNRIHAGQDAVPDNNAGELDGAKADLATQGDDNAPRQHIKQPVSS